MASRDEMIDTINRAYAAREKGDLDGMMALFHEKALFEIIGDKEILEIAGPIVGHQSVREAMVGLVHTFEFKSREILHTIVEGDAVAVQSRLEMRFVPTDKIITTVVLDKFRLQNGKITELVEFVDTALVKNLVSA